MLDLKAEHGPLRPGTHQAPAPKPCSLWLAWAQLQCVHGQLHLMKQQQHQSFIIRVSCAHCNLGVFTVHVNACHYKCHGHASCHESLLLPPVVQPCTTAKGMMSLYSQKMGRKLQNYASPRVPNALGTPTLELRVPWCEGSIVSFFLGSARVWQRYVFGPSLPNTCMAWVITC